MVLLSHRFNTVYVWFVGVWFGLAWFINVLYLSNINYGNFAHIHGYFHTKITIVFLGCPLQQYIPPLGLLSQEKLNSS